MPQTAQQRINHIQARYREWQRLLPELEAAQAQWRQAMQILHELADFYENEYGEIHQAIEEGLEVSLHTEGEYSIMSEDALWNALQEHYDLSWFWLRAATRELDPQHGETGEAETE
ncbi:MULTISPECIES: DUF4298 domain-containing protein [Eikenella]|uniref:DUF4298 domain-containing protein n=1 Tax=Eikenella longinqua TaxID=1795827 RepID=A0A1A9S1X9_9NEIS|nr:MULTISPECIES: DUF4298 domain-containing protein [Eikenella]OAM31533.1 hypothetical protein A7P95_00475 [Eikenella longinqua]